MFLSVVSVESVFGCCECFRVLECFFGCWRVFLSVGELLGVGVF